MRTSQIVHFLIRVVLGLIRGIVNIFKLIGYILKKVFGVPFAYIGRLILKWIITPIYKTSLLVSKRTGTIFTSSKNGFLFVLTSRYTVHAFFIVLTFFVLSQNVFAKNVSADEFGQDSVLLSLVSSEAQDIVETSESIVLNQTNVITEELGSIDAQNVIQESILPGDSEIASLTQGSFVQPSLNSSDTGQVFDLEESYIVEEGETISEIAEKFDVSVKTILDENGLTERSLIRPGQKLTILVTPSGKAVRHEVKRGETLSKISSTYSVSEEDILKFNNLSDADTLQVGQTLIIDGASKPAPQNTFTRVANFFSTAPDTSGPAAGGGTFAWPSPDRRVNQGVRAGHVALDIECKSGQNLYAAESGTVSSSGWSGGYGLRIVINHGGGVQTLYGHFASLYVSAGDYVTRGQAIGGCGSTGYSTGTHLHIEVRVGGRQVNPWTYLR